MFVDLLTLNRMASLKPKLEHVNYDNLAKLLFRNVKLKSMKNQNSYIYNF